MTGRFLYASFTARGESRVVQVLLRPSDVSDRHVRVAGVKLFDGALDDAVRVLQTRLSAGEGSRVATANLDFLALAERDAALARDLEDCALVVCDGAPVAWLARRAGGVRTGRVPGVALVEEICRRSDQAREFRVVLYGSTPEIAQVAAARIESLAPNVVVAGVLCPPFRQLTAEEEAEEQRMIADCAPHLVLVALGCPRQERLAARYFESAPGAIWIGVGGSFDFFAGRRRRAPGWVQSAGGEWLVRMAQEPRRLGKRYLGRDIPFLLRVAPSYVLPTMVWPRRRDP